MKRPKTVLTFAILALLLLSIATLWYRNREKGILTMGRETLVLSKPWPPEPNYEQAYGKNETIRILQPGEKIRYSNFGFDKDFSFYEVEVDGKSGYIIGDGSMKKIKD